MYFWLHKHSLGDFKNIKKYLKYNIYIFKMIYKFCTILYNKF